jgi:hypothetical protein
VASQPGASTVFAGDDLAVVVEVERAEVVAQDPEGGPVALDERDVGCTARQRLDAQTAGTGEEVGDGGVADEVERAERVEHGFAHLVGGRAGVDARGCLEETTTQLSGDDTHASRLRRDRSRHTGTVLEPEEQITCIDCGGRAFLLTPPREDGAWLPGDIVAYRCEDCLDRWDLVLPDDLDDA